ncbi:MAG TPA: zinc-dependent alcohol dehydrogenase [Pseudoduganella sp.]
MLALTYHGAHDVRVETVTDPAIVDPEDVILRITATAICGSDLHIYRGKIPAMKDGDILGHEFMGEVVETGAAVSKFSRGDRVVVPFVIACGHCFFCERQLFSSCEETNPERGAIMNKKNLRPGAALFGYSHLYGGLAGGQAEYVRVPKANTGPIKIPDGLRDEQVLFLSDILPTGYQALLYSDVQAGGTLAIYGAGPVGLMAAACARMKGIERIFIIDHHPYRLAFAQQTYGCIPVNFDEVDAAEYIIEQTSGRGVDGVIDAVGFEAKGSMLETALTQVKLEGSSGAAIRQCIAAVRRGGSVAVPGVYAGFIHGFLFGDAFEKGIRMQGGQTHVQKYLPELLDHIANGRLHPEAIISHRMKISEAAQGYKIFNEKEQDCRKVVLVPD